MRKKIKIKKHQIKADPKYESVLVQRLINKLMFDGKQQKAQKIVYQAATIIEKETNISFEKILVQSIENIKPGIELKTIKLGGGRQRRAIKINPARNETLAIQMLKNSSRELFSSSKKPFFYSLANEIKDSYNKSGVSYKKKENMHKEAESSRVSSY